MKKTLYLMRHGQTIFNLMKKIQGSCDSPLTELGINQAKVARKYFLDNNIEFDACYSSTQERAVDTLEIVTNYSKEYERLKGLKEWNFGRFEAESEDLNPKHKKGETSYGDYFVAYGGESVNEVSDRMNDTLTKIMEKEGNNNVLVVSHGAACYSFFLRWSDISNFDGFPNCCIIKFEYENRKFRYIDIIKHDFDSEIPKLKLNK